MNASVTATRRSIGRRHAVLSILVLAIIVISTANLTWFQVSTQSVLAQEISVQASGQGMSPGLTAAGLVAIASALFLSISKRIGSYIALSATMLAGALIAFAAILVLADPIARFAGVYAEATGADAVPENLITLPWPYATIAGGVLLVVSGVFALTQAGNWAQGSTKYDAPARGSATDTDAHAPQTTPQAGRPAGEELTDERVLWDSLTEGIDPTDR
jgi:uncharacterized membrane protein (TIGR02234 family)